MNEQLKLIIELQKLDSLILSDRIKIDAVPSRITAEEEPLKKAQSAYESAKQRNISLDKKKKDKEREIDDLNEKINKLKQRTGEIKTNKEYQAHLKEIEKAEKTRRSAEDDLLGVMEEIEAASTGLKAVEAEAVKEKARVDALKKDLEQEKARSEEELKKFKDERKLFAEKIEPDVYDQYMASLRVGRGFAVVEATNEICQGCNIHIPPQLFVEIKSGGEIINCPQCRRILYYARPEPETPAAEA